MTPAYLLPLSCLDCGAELDLQPGELHDSDHTSAGASCGCGTSFTVDVRLWRNPNPKSRDEVHADRVTRAAEAAILTNGISG